MEASSKLVIAGYLEVKSLIRAMCLEHNVYIFHVSPHGNQSLQWHTHVLLKNQGACLWAYCSLAWHENTKGNIYSCTKSIVHWDCSTEILRKHAWGCSTIKLCFWSSLRKLHLVTHISVSYKRDDLYMLILLVKTGFFLILISSDLMTFFIYCVFSHVSWTDLKHRAKTVFVGDCSHWMCVTYSRKQASAHAQSVSMCAHEVKGVRACLGMCVCSGSCSLLCTGVLGHPGLFKAISLHMVLCAVSRSTCSKAVERGIFSLPIVCPQSLEREPAAFRASSPATNMANECMSEYKGE